MEKKPSALLRSKLSDIYYSSQGYWKGHAASKKLADAAGTSEDAALAWLKKQANVADLPPAPAKHTKTEVQCLNTKRGSSGRSSISTS